MALFMATIVATELAPFRFSAIAMSSGAFLCNSAVLYWLRALHIVAKSKLPATSGQKSGDRGVFLNALLWLIVWCVATALVTALPSSALWAVAVVTIISGYFFLRACWSACSALTAFENSDRTFQTFIQVLYLPIGVWFLQRRLRALLFAPARTTSGIT